MLPYPTHPPAVFNSMYWRRLTPAPPTIYKHGPRYKCAACKIVAHQSCVAVLIDRLRFTCKATFRDVGVRAYREQASTAVTHHWVHRRSQKGKCRQCGKVSGVGIEEPVTDAVHTLSPIKLAPKRPEPGEN
ncbi:Eye-specific diacylglycerol kinase [Frankliniella fusca]|uniref:Eye-specific diacylglycerol kinase n=1 Tax=Frankliniella fusca TaxID=407009 RepID=A0AAE1HXZ6_9NEOP|nr:Eye-specific diacylglycerol kinase [Frankliniella fusca]